ncbi:MAG: histidine kinase dimerization/phospho-acceptor domain-containing protein [Chitinispirillaceae bacterium]
MKVIDWGDSMHNALVSEVNESGIAPVMVQADKGCVLQYLISGIVHDMNNPLNLIMLSADVLESENQNSIEQDRLGSLVSTINKGTDKINGLISVLREFNNADDREDCVDLNEYVRKALFLTDYFLRCSTGQVEVNIDDSVPVNWGKASLFHMIASVILKTCMTVEREKQKFRITTDKESRYLTVEYGLLDRDEFELRDRTDIFDRDNGWWAVRCLARSFGADLHFRLTEGTRAVTTVCF